MRSYSVTASLAGIEGSSHLLMASTGASLTQHGTPQCIATLMADRVGSSKQQASAPDPVKVGESGESSRGMLHSVLNAVRHPASTTHATHHSKEGGLSMEGGLDGGFPVPPMQLPGDVGRAVLSEEEALFLEERAVLATMQSRPPLPPSPVCVLSPRSQRLFGASSAAAAAAATATATATIASSGTQAQVAMAETAGGEESVADLTLAAERAVDKAMKEAGLMASTHQLATG